jgi:FtsZ-binding cell division protein ZapB
MPIRKPNDVTIQKLQYELKEVKRTRDEYRSDNDALRNQNMMLLETLSDLTTNDEYWSEMSLKSGIVFRLKNVLTQIKQMGEM